MSKQQARNLPDAIPARKPVLPADFKAAIPVPAFLQSRPTRITYVTLTPDQCLYERELSQREHYIVRPITPDLAEKLREADKEHAQEMRDTRRMSAGF